MSGPLAVPPVPPEPVPPDPPDPPLPPDPPDGDDGDDGEEGFPPEVFGLAGFSLGWLGVLGVSLGDSPGSVGVGDVEGCDAFGCPPPSSFTAAATTPPMKMSSTAAKSTPMNWRSGRAIGLVHHLAG
jgi:hypothetical protein